MPGTPPGLPWPAAAVTLRLMRLLDRYLLRELLAPLFFCLGGFLIFWIAFDLSTSLASYQEKRLGFADVLELYIVKLPEILVLILPIVLLLALLYALTNHARHHEITAIRAAGISLGRICAPYLAVGLLLGIASFFMNEYLVPESADRQDNIKHRHEMNSPEVKNPNQLGKFSFVNSRDGQDWNFDDFLVASRMMVHPRIGWTAGGDQFWIAADRGEYLDGVWTFSDHVSEFRNKVPVAVSNNTAVVPELSETPDQIRREKKFPGQNSNLSYQPVEVPITEILDYLELHPTGLDPKIRRGWLTQMHGRIAAPWTCLVVVLIAIPFGAASGRRNLFVGVASSILICFVYYILLKLGLALGSSGYLPPWLAAWFANLAFGITSIFMILRVR